MVRGILAILLLLVTGIDALGDAGRAPSITTATAPSLNYDSAYAAQARGDLDLAILFYDRVIRAGGLSDWDAAAVLTDRGGAYVDKGRLDRAIEDFDTAIKIEPDYSLAFANRGIAYHRKGDLDRAITDYDAAIRLDPGDADSYRNRGLAFYFK
ncbi:MAG TPA: tetratricopeptide repeat protein, partial [Dongiaceae bacterium]